MTDTATGIDLPWSEETEQYTLALALMNPKAQDKLTAELCPADFYRLAHGQIFAAILELRAEGHEVDPVVVSDYLRGEKWFQEIEGTGYLHYLAVLPAAVSCAGEYSDIVRDHARRRETVRIGNALSEGTMAAAEAREHLLGLEADCTRRLPFVSARQLADETPERLEPVWDGYIYRGTVTELSGRIKNGKTTFMLALAHAVVTGEPFLGRRTAQSPVVYLTEQNRPSFVAALERANLLGCPDLHLLFRYDYRGTWPIIAAAARREALERGAGLVIVDTLHDWSGLLDENDAGQALAAMRPLHEIAAAGPAVAANRHERKGGGEIGENARGSTAFGGSADVLMVFRLGKGNGHDNRRELEVAGRLHEKKTLIIELTDGRYELLGTEADVQLRACRESLLALMPDDEPATEKELLAAYSEGERPPRSTFQRAIRDLIDGGEVEPSGAGKKGSPYRYTRRTGDYVPT